MPPVPFPKVFRCSLLRIRPELAAWRRRLGAEKFDQLYRSVYLFISGLAIGRCFRVGDLCRRHPEYHDLVLLLCEMYHDMDFNVCLAYDSDTDQIHILPTMDGRTSGLYAPPDVYSRRKSEFFTDKE